MPRGGARTGGGRPKLPPDQQGTAVAFWLNPNQKALAKRLGGSKAVAASLELMARLSSVATSRGISTAELVELILLQCFELTQEPKAP